MFRRSYFLELAIALIHKLLTELHELLSVLLVLVDYRLLVELTRQGASSCSGLLRSKYEIREDGSYEKGTHAVQ